ncbi:MAG: hypothetical protein MK165_04280 [Pirellulaceae bacterium]|nr:hypothetical protein [Pirellulaceae bacterium]
MILTIFLCSERQLFGGAIHLCACLPDSRSNRYHIPGRADASQKDFSASQIMADKSGKLMKSKKTLPTGSLLASDRANISAE